MAKAVRAAKSAQVLLAEGDMDGACNRAYYAMFDAARAALLASEAPVEPEIGRTHGGLVSAFSLHLVKTRTCFGGTGQGTQQGGGTPPGGRLQRRTR